MIKNYFKTAWRTIILNRTYSLTNLIGLTLGLLAVMLITTWVIDELSYDRQWKRSNELYRIRTIHYDQDGNIQYQLDRAPAGLSSSLTSAFPEILAYTNIELQSPKLVIDSIADRHMEMLVLESDTNFFNLFEVKALEGNPKQIVSHAKNLVVTRSAHQKYFNGKDVVGKTFYNLPEEGAPEAYYVNAILEDLPQNSHLHTDAILLIPHQQAFEPGKAGAYQGQYIQIRSETDTASLSKKINTWYATQQASGNKNKVEFTFQSIKDVHLSPTSMPNVSYPMRDIYLLAGICALALVLVCINFVNLTFAHAMKRTLETGIRKVLGANKRHLLAQMSVESLLLYGTALLLAFSLYLIALPIFERYLGHPLTITFQSSLPMFTGLIFCWLTLGIFCSLFPALTLSKTKVSEGLRKRVSVLNLPLNIGFTRGLIAIQFTIAIVVIISMLTIRAQLQYMDNKDLGYEPTNIMVVDFTQWEGKAQVFKQALLQHPSIMSASFASWTPFSGAVNFRPVEDPANPEVPQKVAIIQSDFDFIATMGMQLLEGRELQPQYALDAVEYTPETIQREIYSNVLTTESTMQKFQLALNEGSTSLKHTPVGILKDFHGASLRYPMGFLAFEAQKDWEMGCLIVRATEGKEKEALSVLNSTWNTFFPNRLSRINWLEEQVRNQYQKEQKQFQQLAFFSGISMLLALLGVLGIAIYTIERKVKEIGIRKVLGASSVAIVKLISSSFTKLVGIAIIIAFPISWWLMHKWLEDFAFRIDMPVSLFVLTGLFTLFSMLAVVGLRSFRAAQSNPVNSLRDE